MALDFQQVRDQIKKLGENALAYQRRMEALREETESLFTHYADKLEHLQNKVERAVAQNKRLRCAVPLDEALNLSFPLPSLPEKATILAADGSQINPNSHEALDYYLINVGAIQMLHGEIATPKMFIKSDLFYDEDLYTPAGMITEGMVALIRDESERSYLAELASSAQKPVITLTDGPIELWGDEQMPFFSKRFQKYLAALSMMNQKGIITAGYVDKPRSDLVVRLLEIATLADDKLDQAGRERPYRGVTDRQLFKPLLGPGERSAIFRIQSKTSDQYKDDLAIHFFYLNVGSQKDSWIVRVEIPFWVVKEPAMRNQLHAILVQQCQILGDKAYPYVLHRAHEIALVTRGEKEQVEQMIAIERRSRGADVGQKSNKQYHKDNR